MATVTIAKIKIRRGTDAERKLVILDNGELGFTTDVQSRRLFVGDGSTAGGSSVSTKLYQGNLDTTISVFKFAQLNDLIFNTGDSKLYALTGTDANNFPLYSSRSAYMYIGPRTDDSSITFSPQGKLTVTTNSISAINIHSSVYSGATTGLYRSGATAPLSINHDNSTIKINTSNQLFVNPAVINISSLITTNQNINGTGFGIDNLPTIAPATPGKLWKSGSNLMIS